MNSGIPAVIGIPLLIVICSVTLARIGLMHSTVADRRINTALVFAALCCLLRDSTAQALIVDVTRGGISPSMMYALSELAVIPAGGALFLLGYTWINRAEPPLLAPIVRAAITICVIVTAALVLNARSRGIEVPIPSGWAVIAYSSPPLAAAAAIVFHDSLIYWFSVMLIVTCVREMRRQPDRRGVAICVALAVIAFGILMQTACISIATILAATGQHNAFIMSLGSFDRFTVVLWTAIGAAVAAVPLVTLLLERAHLDSYSRQRRRLLPLWRDLTETCPEIVYLSRHGSRNSSRYYLHRTVVEIRDCILILSRYARQSDHDTIGEGGSPARRRALRLASASLAKNGGQPPSHDVLAQQSAATDLTDELEELSRLADQWTAAKTRARELLAEPTPPKAFALASRTHTANHHRLSAKG